MINNDVKIFLGWLIRHSRDDLFSDDKIINGYYDD
jgi:hypothetical protein